MEKLIFEKICAIQKEIDGIGKNEVNQMQHFNFRGIDTVYNHLHNLLAKHDVFSVSDILDERSEERQTKKGGMLIYRILKMKYRFYTSDGSYVETVVIGEGMDSGDKASNKAMAIAHKYSMLQMFTIPTEDKKDPDAETHVVTGPPKKTQDPNKPTDKQRKAIFAIANKIWPADTTNKLKDFCRGMGLPESSREMTKKQATNLIEDLKGLEG